MSSIKDLLKDLKADNMLVKSVETKEYREKVCEKCGKTMSSYHSLWRHKNKCLTDRRILPQCEKSGTINSEPLRVKVQDDHRNKIPILKLKWNGSMWQRDSSCEKWYYKMKLGRDLDNLIRKRAINEEVLNAYQKSYLQIYREMFTD